MQSSLSADVVLPQVIARVEAGFRDLRASDWIREVSAPFGGISYRAQLGELSILLQREDSHSANARLTVDGMQLRSSVALANEMFKSVSVLLRPQLSNKLSSVLEDLLRDPARALERATISGLVYDHETGTSKPDGIVEVNFTKEQVTLELERFSWVRAISGQNPSREISLRRVYGSARVWEDEATLKSPLTSEQAGGIYRAVQQAFEARAAKVLEAAVRTIAEQIPGKDSYSLSYSHTASHYLLTDGDDNKYLRWGAKANYSVVLPELFSEQEVGANPKFYLWPDRDGRVGVRGTRGEQKDRGPITLSGILFKGKVVQYLAEQVEITANNYLYGLKKGINLVATALRDTASNPLFTGLNCSEVKVVFADTSYYPDRASLEVSIDSNPSVKIHVFASREKVGILKGAQLYNFCAGVCDFSGEMSLTSVVKLDSVRDFSSYEAERIFNAIVSLKSPQQ